MVLFIRTFLLAYFPILDVLLFRTPADRGHVGSSLRAANSEQTAFSKKCNAVLHGAQQMMQQQLQQQTAFMTAVIGLSPSGQAPFRRLQTFPNTIDSASPSSQLQLIPPGPKRLGASLAPQLSSRCQDERELTNGPILEEVAAEEEQADRREETADTMYFIISVCQNRR